MKNFKSLSIASLLVFSFISQMSFAAATTTTTTKAKAAKKINFSEDVDTLGGNQELMDMADNIKSESRSRIVQDRIVDRRNRVEFGLSYGGIVGGDTYVQTQSVGFAVDYHINPRWSLGVRYFDYGNSLTDEGQRVFDQARASYAAGGRANAVDIDYPLHSTIAVINWYPIYGKTSLLDMGIAQFDLYLIAGGGQITLSSGDTSTLTTGIGVGVWITKHVTARLEARYQYYQDQIVTGSRDINAGVGTLGLGWIL